MVAIPERCWSSLSATRSALRMARAGPLRRITIWSAWTWSPSLALGSNCTRSSSSSKTRRATLSPQITPSCLQTTLPRQVIWAGISASVVTSPAPRSSAKAARIRASRCSGASVSVMGCRVAVKVHSSLCPDGMGPMPAVAARREVTAVMGSPALLSIQGGADDREWRGGPHPAAPTGERIGRISTLIPHLLDRPSGGSEAGTGPGDPAGRPHQPAELLVGGEASETTVHRQRRQLGDAAHRAATDGRHRRLTGPAAEHQALQQRVASQAVGAVHTGPSHLPAGEEAGHGGRAVEVSDHPDDGVVGGGGDGDRGRRRVEAMPPARRDDGG